MSLIGHFFRIEFRFFFKYNIGIIFSCFCQPVVLRQFSSVLKQSPAQQVSCSAGLPHQNQNVSSGGTTAGLPAAGNTPQHTTEEEANTALQYQQQPNLKAAGPLTHLSHTSIPVHFNFPNGIVFDSNAIQRNIINNASQRYVKFDQYLKDKIVFRRPTPCQMSASLKNDELSFLIFFVLALHNV